jgi:hypothetical protein
VKLSEPFVIDAEFLIKYFGIPTSISSSSYSTGTSSAYIHFTAKHRSYQHTMLIGGYRTDIVNSIELQLLHLVTYLQVNDRETI